MRSNYPTSRRSKLASRRRRRRRRLYFLLLILAFVVATGAFAIAQTQASALSGKAGTGIYEGSAPEQPTDATAATNTDATAPAGTGAATAPTTTAATAPVVSTITTSTTAASSGEPAAAISRVETDRKMIALTFDDNYQTDRSFQVVDILKRYQVPATVFVIGHYTENGPALAEAIAEAGFEVGDHTFSHTDCSSTPAHWLPEEIGGGTDSFRKITGAPTSNLFRPPYGYYNEETLRVTGEEGFAYAVLWDIDTRDWEGKSADEIRSTVLNEARPGSIVLMHFNAPHTFEALPSIIEGLRGKGYQLVTVSDLLWDS